MRVLFLILLAAGLSLGMFAVSVRSGSGIVKLDGSVAAAVALTGLLELAASCIGYGCGVWFLSRALADHSVFWSRAMASILLILVGVRMLTRAFVKGKHLIERRIEHLALVSALALAWPVCLDAFLAGAACGLLMFQFLPVGLAMLAAAIILALAGIVSGRSFGISLAGQSCAAGGIIVCILGVLLQVLPV